MAFKFTHKNRKELTEMLNAALPVFGLDVNWWRDTKEDGGYRLSIMGFSAMMRIVAQDEVHSFPLKSRITPAKFLMALDKSMETPYYIIEAKGKTSAMLLLFSPKEATVAMLCDDPELFAAGLGPRKR